MAEEAFKAVREGYRYLLNEGYQLYAEGEGTFLYLFIWDELDYVNGRYIMTEDKKRDLIERLTFIMESSTDYQPEEIQKVIDQYVNRTLNLIKDEQENIEQEEVIVETIKWIIKEYGAYILLHADLYKVIGKARQGLIPNSLTEFNLRLKLDVLIQEGNLSEYIDDNKQELLNKSGIGEHLFTEVIIDFDRYEHYITGEGFIFDLEDNTLDGVYDIYLSEIREDFIQEGVEHSYRRYLEHLYQIT